MRPLAVAFVLVALSVCTIRYALHLHDASLKSLHVTTSAAADELLADPPARSPSQPPRKDAPSALGDSPDGIFHFVQISDLHVSRFHKVGGHAHLQHFLQHEMNLVAPDLVLATGDLTDAKTRNALNSVQHRQEWLAYHSALSQNGVLARQNGRFWWDQRGNHDCFNVPSFSSPHNIFRELSAVRREGYAFRVHKPFGVYRFVAVDACPVVGTSRPINFFGYLDSSDMDFLASEIANSRRNNDNHTFVMSHYPTGTMLFGRTSTGTPFRTISQHISLWLCGHLHKLFAGLGETMYAYQDTFLELELGDLKSHGMFRIVVVDHDLVSFVDTPIRASVLPIPHANISTDPPSGPPIVVVTNPKDSRFAIPDREPVDLIGQSTHIRILAWSERPISHINISIDGTHIPAKATYNGTGRPWRNQKDQDPYLPLYTIPWRPSDYNDNKPHILKACVCDSIGACTNSTVDFRIDGNRIADMGAGPGGFIISIPFGILFKDLFVISYIIVYLLFLLVPKLFVCITTDLGTYSEWRRNTSYHLIALDVVSQAYQSRIRSRQATITNRLVHKTVDLDFTLRATFFRFCELTTYPSLFYPLFFLNLYLLIGPWFIGEFVPSAYQADPSSTSISDSGRRYGFMMVYGVWFTDGTWTPLLDTWLYAFYGIVYTVLPLEFYLSFCCTSPALLYTPTNPRHTHPIHQRWYVHVITGISIVYHLVDSVSMALFYGYISVIVAPAKTWLVIWAAYVLWTWRNGPRGPAAHAYTDLHDTYDHHNQQKYDDAVQPTETNASISISNGSQFNQSVDASQSPLLRPRKPKQFS